MNKGLCASWKWYIFICFLICISAVTSNMEGFIKILYRFGGYDLDYSVEYILKIIFWVMLPIIKHYVQVFLRKTLERVIYCNNSRSKAVFVQLLLGIQPNFADVSNSQDLLNDVYIVFTTLLDIPSIKWVSVYTQFIIQTLVNNKICRVK